MSATLSKGVVPPLAVGTGKARMTARLSRADAGRRMRMGIRRSPSVSLGTLASMSPRVATRATWAMDWTLTPRREASSGLGRMITSGPVGGCEGRGSATVFRARICRSSSSLARISWSPSWPVR